MKAVHFSLVLLSLFSHPTTAQDEEDNVVTIVTTAPPAFTTALHWTQSAPFTSAILNSTNHYRTQHSAANLTWNATLSRFAADFANSSDACDFEHSGGPYGENLAMGYLNVTAAVEAWGEEREEFDFGDGGFSEETGHFTQLVWRNTTGVGCGRRLCGERGWMLVCEYWPPGNVEEQYDEQVEEHEGGGSLVRPTMFAMWLAVCWCVLCGL